ncbi:MAG: thrombospondin type 3 repeat-containing protein, partial [Myxococcota bacterium]|nr:thrombospondin type 3 repeat-containing protein [Myxococcota bacterium]
KALRTLLILAPLAVFVSSCGQIDIPNAETPAPISVVWATTDVPNTSVEGQVVSFRVEARIGDAFVESELLDGPAEATYINNRLRWVIPYGFVGGSWTQEGLSQVAVFTFSAMNADGSLSQTDVMITVANDLDEDGIPDDVDDDDDGDGLLDGDELSSGTLPYAYDTDDDSIDDALDNCPNIPNTQQTDTNKDGAGDDCDDDDDGDNIPDSDDNCPKILNTDQLKSDEDMQGDACDDDDDNDSVLDTAPDNCPTVPNTNQIDTDQDTIGDECDPNIDNDIHLNASDNCPTVSNDDQLNLDGDSLGDACDPDRDGDGVNNSEDSCPDVASDDQSDSDKDGLGDVCDPCPNHINNDDPDNDLVCGTDDNCPTVSNVDQLNTDAALSTGDTLGDACDDDDDGDGIPDTADNCPLVFGLDQTNTDGSIPGGDLQGDLCDTDDDADTIPDVDDNCPLIQNVDQANMDMDEAGDACDANIDGDLYNNSEDNCVLAQNDGQADLDTDGIGDACDDDKDGDGINNSADNCPSLHNVGQANSDNDANGDACDLDDDNDGLNDEDDNCPTASNPQQANLDSDTQGDVCDPDDDDDGIEDVLDNCPSVYNTNQVDIDGDTIGAACDIDITLLSIDMSNVAKVEGTARSGTVALALQGNPNCGLSGDCINPSIFALQLGDYAVEAPEWAIFGENGGELQPPVVGSDGAAYFRAIQQDGSLIFQHAWNGELTDAIPTAAASEVILDLGPDGVYATVDVAPAVRVYRLNGSMAPELLLTSSSVSDLGGQGLFRATDGTVYIPSQSANGQYSLQAHTGGTPLFPLGNQQHQEMTFLQVDAVDQSPWFCVRKFGTSPARLVKLAFGALDKEIEFLGMGCTNTNFEQRPNGDWWAHIPSDDAIGTTLSFGTPVKKLANSNQGAQTSTITLPCQGTLYFSGDNVYVTSACTNEDITLYDTLSGSMDTSQWVSSTASAFSGLVTANLSGQLAVVFQQSKTGVSPIRAMAAFGNGTIQTFDVSPNLVAPFLQNAWITDSAVWVLTIVGASQMKIYGQEPGLSSSPTSLDTAGTAVVLQQNGHAVLAVNALGSNVYRLNGATATPLVDAVVSPNALPELVPNTSGNLWMAYAKTATTWAVGEMDDGDFQDKLDGLLQPPTTIHTSITPTTEYWLHLSASEGEAVVSVTDTATLWLSGKASINPLYMQEGDAPDVLWGALVQDDIEANFMVCSVPPESTCWTTSSPVLPYWTGVSLEGTVYSVRLE